MQFDDQREARDAAWLHVFSCIQDTERSEKSLLRLHRRFLHDNVPKGRSRYRSYDALVQYFHTLDRTAALVTLCNTLNKRQLLSKVLAGH